MASSTARFSEILTRRGLSVDFGGSWVLPRLWTRRLAQGPPTALAQSKRLLDNSHAVTLEQASDDAGRAQTINFGTADAVGAIGAFLEKRNASVLEGR